MSTEELYEKINDAGFEISRKIVGRIMDGFDMPISHPHIYLMMLIKRQGARTITDIANHLCITLSAVTSLTNKLFALGLIRRMSSENDRRVVRIELTEEGLNALKRVDEIRLKLFKKYFYNVSGQELETCLNVLNKILVNVDEEQKNLKNSLRKIE